MTAEIYHGDSRELLQTIEACSVDSIVTDPPYGLVSTVKRFGKEGSAPAKSDGATGVYKRASAGFMGQCYHPDTEVLTIDGWRKVGAVWHGDIVATLDPTTRRIEWQPATQVHVYPFTGELVRIDHRSACQVVTPNHNVVLSYDGGESLRFEEATSLRRAFHLFAQAEPAVGEASDEITLTITRDYGRERKRIQETKTFPAKPFFRFFGLWLGDGAVCNRKDDHPANDFILFSVKKQRKIEMMRETLTQLGVRFTETSGTHLTTFYCYDFVLLETLRPLGGATQKHIPRWIFRRDATDLEEIYLGMMETDGCVQGQGQHVYFTSSRQLADDFQELCLLTGRSAASKYDAGGQMRSIGEKSFVTRENWTLCVLQPGKRMYGECSDTSSNLVSRVAYEGPVYCVGVERHHTLYTRFEGKPVWSGNSWDGTGIEKDPEFWELCFAILKPGGHLLAFGGTRTFHRIGCAIEDAGFDLRDTFMWLYGTGFPKSHKVGDGLGTALKPAWEPIFMFRKPVIGTVAENVLEHGTGALNIDGCRVPMNDGEVNPSVARRQGAINHLSDRPAAETEAEGRMASRQSPEAFRKERPGEAEGRWPANVIHDGSPEVTSMFPVAPGQQGRALVEGDGTLTVFGKWARSQKGQTPRGDEGSAARFFYSPKATKNDRHTDWRGLDIGIQNIHPTVKPTGLMQWLLRLVTPPGGLVLDPFAGSGSTGKAARLEGFRFIGIEGEEGYARIAAARVGSDFRGRMLGLKDALAENAEAQRADRG